MLPKKFIPGNKNNFNNADIRAKAAYKLKITYLPGNIYYEQQMQKKHKWDIHHSFNTKNNEAGLHCLMENIINPRKKYIKKALLYNNQTDTLIKEII